MLGNPFSNAFGLDLGDLSAKLVQLKNVSFPYRQLRYELKNYRAINFPAGTIVNGEIQKPEEVRRCLQELLQGNKEQKPIKNPWVVVGLPETQSFIKLIEMDKASEEPTAEEIKEVAKKHIPYEDDGSYYIEWQIMPPQEENKNRVLIGAVPKVIADSYTYLLESLGLGVIALEIEALSIARSLITASKGYEDEARGLLDLGAARSSFIVYDHDIVQFSTSIPFSGEIITTALSQEMHLSREEAEKIKMEQGLLYHKKNKSWQIISSLTDDLIKHIQDAIQFYYSHFPHANRITRVTMCGGGSNMKNIDNILSKKLQIFCSPGHPWKNLNSKKPIIMNTEDSMRYPTAIGLALRAADNPFFTYDTI